MSTTTESSRAELVEKYVRREALATVLRNLELSTARVKPFDGDELLGEDIEQFTDAFNLGVWTELWPGDPDAENAEHELADARSMTLAAGIYLRLADNVDFLRREASYLLELASERQQRVMEAGGDALTGIAVPLCRREEGDDA